MHISTVIYKYKITKQYSVSNQEGLQNLVQEHTEEWYWDGPNLTDYTNV